MSMQKDGMLLKVACAFGDNGAAKQAPLEELGCKGSLKGMKGQLYEGGISPM